MDELHGFLNFSPCGCLYACVNGLMFALSVKQFDSFVRPQCRNILIFLEEILYTLAEFNRFGVILLDIERVRSKVGKQLSWFDLCKNTLFWGVGGSSNCIRPSSTNIELRTFGLCFWR